MSSTTNAVEKKTQSQMFKEIYNFILDNQGPDEMLEFLNGRIDLLATQAEASKKRKAAKKQTDDPLMTAVAAQIGSELKTVNDIIAAIEKDFPEVSAPKVVARLTALGKQGLIGKIQVSLGGGKKVMAYALSEYMPKD